MDILKVIGHTLEGHLTNTGNLSIVHYTHILHLIYDFVGDYSTVKDLESRKISLKNSLDTTNLDWMRMIILKNISKLEKKQESFFGTCSPPGTPNSSSSGEVSSGCGIEINVFESLGSSSETTTFKGQFGSPTSKLEKKQESFSGTYSPPGTQNSSSSV